MRKKRIALVLAAALCLSCLPVSVRAEEEISTREAAYEAEADSQTKIMYADSFQYKTGGVTWLCNEAIVQDENSDETVGAVIYGCYNAGPELKIPGSVKDTAGNTRTVIGVVSRHSIDEDSSDYEFSFNEEEGSCYNIGTISFPDSVYLIGEGVFDSSLVEGPFSLLTEIKLPDNKDLVIEERAFWGCGRENGLGTTVTFGSKPIKIASEAFGGCTGLTALELPQGSDVAYSAFSDCCNIKTIINAPAELYLGEGDQQLEKYEYDPTITGAVYGPTKYEEEETGNPFPNLTSVALPANCTGVGGFSNFTSLQTVNMPSGLKEIQDYAFYNCTSLTGIDALPAGIESVGSMAFYGCKNLHMSVNHPDNYYEDAYDNSGIRSITFRNDVLIINGALRGCENLESITIQGNTSATGQFMTRDGVLYINEGEWMLERFPAGKSGGSYTLPSDIGGIYGPAFDSCKFSEINLPVTMTEAESVWCFDNALGDAREYRVFDNMKTTPTLYVVHHSIADEIFGPGGSQSYTPLRYVKGPNVSITYQLNGGLNPVTNPTSIPGGESVTLSAPTRSGYTFSGWKNDYDDELLKNNVLTPRNYQLYDGVTLTAVWKQNGSSGSSSERNRTLSYAASEIQDLKSLVNFMADEVRAKNLSVKAIKVKAKGSKKAKVTWKPNKSANGYQIQYATNKKFTKSVKYKKVTGTAKKSATLKKLKKSKKYYVRIRTFKTLTLPNGEKENVYGKWTKAKKIKMK